MSITLAAAPSGARVGFCAVSKAGGPQLLLSVVPKCWSSAPPGIATIENWPDVRHHDVVLHETQRLHVTDPDPEMLELLEHSLRAARREVDGSVRWDTCLLAPDVSPARAAASGDPLESGFGATELLTLFDHLDLLRPDTSDLTAKQQSSSLVRPLLYRQLLDEVRSVAHLARRAYLPRSERRTTVRGRVEPSSLIWHSVSSDPRLICHFDELTPQTALLGVVCAALEWVAEGRGGRSRFTGRYSDRALRDEAVSLRRAFVVVEALSPPVALRLGPRVHLTRLDQPWRRALTLSLTILRVAELVASEEEQAGIEAVELSFGTDKLWEGIVEQLLKRCSFDQVMPQGSQPRELAMDPWHSAGRPTFGSRPDIVTRRKGAVWVFDAKYKRLEVKPSRDDQYQMFSYSYLVKDGGRPAHRTVLVYASSGTADTWVRGREPDAGSAMLLVAVPIAFPGLEDVRSRSSWLGYLDQAAEELHRHVA